MRDRLDLSVGSIERTLRQLCASGDVRAIRPVEEEYSLIAPSKWSAAEVDYHAWVYVSGDDLRHWFDNQEPAKVEVRTSKKRELARQAIKALWPNGIPDISNPEIERQVGKWITSYCKQHNLTTLDISSDTILRAAGRK
jgi:hypothetical protein